MVSFKVTVRCKDSAVLDVEQRLAEGEVEVIYSSGRVVVSSKEEQTVIRQSRSLLEDQEKEEEWRRVNGRLKRLPNSSTSTVGEKVVVASLGQQTTKVEQWGLGKLVVKQVTEEGCGELCDPCANCGHCDICHHTLTKEEEEEV